VEVEHGKDSIVIQKDGAGWKLTAPEALKADTGAVTQLLWKGRGRRALAFLSQSPGGATARPRRGDPPAREGAGPAGAALPLRVAGRRGALPEPSGSRREALGDRRQGAEVAPAAVLDGEARRQADRGRGGAGRGAGDARRGQGAHRADAGRLGAGGPHADPHVRAERREAGSRDRRRQAAGCREERGGRGEPGGAGEGEH